MVLGLIIIDVWGGDFRTPSCRGMDRVIEVKGKKCRIAKNVKFSSFEPHRKCCSTFNTEFPALRFRYFNIIIWGLSFVVSESLAKSSRK